MEASYIIYAPIPNKSVSIEHDKAEALAVARRAAEETGHAVFVAKIIGVADIPKVPAKFTPVKSAKA
jgi:hypothetical protein